ncbi:tellurium resistance protein TerC [Epilithonimonas ginsengisoli]|uniref:Tellurium resistance protein TerC n=1 Tax=Epilithonimonas ginsengisoli TaxID=1245592 RepID=A0ABU4JJY4_9FLAO|nr:MULTISPECIES: MauE/DoxX family redox-associated membrane protein [Chryseobacterium group]MBV6880459.1 tellurium resistance protein TerC [Epilithonimonas sp. FP105]MDW8550024.1 tellurium resistance protein TerC [Epilithonimonas ginsengisoli]
MKNYLNTFILIVSYFFILLFVYAGISKILDFENFQVQIAQSPLLSAYAGSISYIVIIIELIAVLLLGFTITRKWGLQLSFCIMASFTAYIFLILNYSEHVPCSCGGILEKMGWKEHLIFNIVCVAILGYGNLIDDSDGKVAIKKNRPLHVKILHLSTLCIISFGVVLLLFFSSDHIIKKENNFTRRYLKYPVNLIQTKELDNPYLYFAGGDKGFLHLANKKKPLDLQLISKDLKKSELRKISIDNKNYPFKNINVKTYRNQYYLFDGTVPIIFRGDIKTLKSKTIDIGKFYFSQLAVIDSANFILRIQSTETKELELARYNTALPTKFYVNKDILDRQTDGIFDADGLLTSDTDHSEFIYIYNYRNQFATTDQYLHKVQKFNTIDTISKAQIKTKKLKDGKNKMTTPVLKVNNKSVAYKNVLFNHSLVKGRHEPMRLWKESDVIDLYSIDKGEYIGSFYLYEEDRQKISDFYVTDDHLYVIRKNLLSQYRFSNSIKKNFKTGKAENLNKE